MSGIAGLMGSGDAAAMTLAVSRMVRAMRHRGPDEADVRLLTANTQNVVIGAAQRECKSGDFGRMPFVDVATGNRAVFDGHLYNGTLLRRELSALGHDFVTQCHAEILLKAWQHWGEESLQKLRGSYAFAIWDEAQKSMLLARDRMGERPLICAALPNGQFAFASELRALLDSQLLPRRLDPAGLEVFLFNGYIVAPSTLIRGANSLLPGEMMRVAPSGAVQHQCRYWKLPKGTANLEQTPAQVAEQVDCVRGQLEESVILRMGSAPVVGAYLSGGLDSSAIVAMMSRQERHVPTFSITFEEAAYDESPYSQWVADKFETKHTAVRLSGDQFAQWLPDALCAMDSPTIDGVNTYCAARAASEHGMTALLSGIGGDELFSGYPQFDTQPPVALLKRMANRMLMGKHPGVGSIAPTAWASKMALTVPQPLINLIEQAVCQPRRASGPSKLIELMLDKRVGQDHDHLLRAYQALHIGLPMWTRRAVMNGLSEEAKQSTWWGLSPTFVESFFDSVREDNPEETVARMSILLFLNERVLRDTDSASMAVSVDTHSPLVDHRLIEGTWQLPSALRCDPSYTKEFAWFMFRPYLGEDFPKRKKQGFSFPFKKWLMEGRFDRLIDPLLNDHDFIESVGLKPKAIAEVSEAFRRQSPPIHWTSFWTIFVLLSWCREHQVTL